MSDKDKLPELGPVAIDNRPADEPSEPFPCPSCGQMLSPSCRVCVACHYPIDPAQIRKEPPAPVIAVAALRTLAPVQFPWRLFLLFFLAVMAGGVVSESLIGPTKTQLLAGAFQLLSAIWVSFDGYAKRIPHPLRWALATMFPTWLFILPWYLVRRRQPEAPCPFVEARVKPATMAALFILLAVLFYLVFKNAPPA